MRKIIITEANEKTAMEGIHCCTFKGTKSRAHYFVAETQEPVKVVSELKHGGVPAVHHTFCAKCTASQK